MLVRTQVVLDWMEPIMEYFKEPETYDVSVLGYSAGEEGL